MKTGHSRAIIPKGNLAWILSYKGIILSRIRELKQLEEKLPQSQMENTRLSIKLEKVENDLTNCEDALRNFRNKNIEQEEAYSTLQEKLSELTRKLNSSELEKTELYSKMKREEDQFVKLTGKLSEISALLANYEEECNELRGMVRSQDDEVIRLTAKIFDNFPKSEVSEIQGNALSPKVQRVDQQEAAGGLPIKPDKPEEFSSKPLCLEKLPKKRDSLQVKERAKTPHQEIVEKSYQSEAASEEVAQPLSSSDLIKIIEEGFVGWKEKTRKEKLQHLALIEGVDPSMGVEKLQSILPEEKDIYLKSCLLMYSLKVLTLQVTKKYAQKGDKPG